jgi:hypothetical protein
MKTRNLPACLVHGLVRLQGRRVLFCCCLGMTALGVIGFATRSHEGFVAHEWGTFTSVQGGDGVLLDWRPLETSRLPKFVYDWTKPGLNRRVGGQMLLQKQVILTLQRMETPVIYFYADNKQTVDVTVDFPQGKITEWYPQASQIGPSFVPTPPAVVKLDGYAHKVGVKRSFTFASLLKNPATDQSRARWAHIEILPAKKNAKLMRSLPMDRSGSHYFAARETDASVLETDSLVATNPIAEHEKFIFYRGVGTFGTPLRVTMNTDNMVTITNKGTEPLRHLFVLSVENGAGKFTEVDGLASGETRPIQLNADEPCQPLEKVSAKLGERMADSLVSEGLYRREAVAMVNTWKDSWFAEDGLRVLYVLPRAWTDRTLPLKMNPAPRELVRVMVGRAEVLSPTLQKKLANDLAMAEHGDNEARTQVLAEFKKLGRFAEPAWRLASRGSKNDFGQTGWKLLQASAQPATQWQ